MGASWPMQGKDSERREITLAAMGEKMERVSIGRKLRLFNFLQVTSCLIRKRIELILRILEFLDNMPSKALMLVISLVQNCHPESISRNPKKLKSISELLCFQDWAWQCHRKLHATMRSVIWCLKSSSPMPGMNHGKGPLPCHSGYRSMIITTLT